MTQRQYRIAVNEIPGGWVDANGPALLMNTSVDRIEFRDAPVPCGAKAPFQVEGADVVCDGVSADECRVNGYHLYDQQVAGYYDGCYHEVSLTWSVMPDGE